MAISLYLAAPFPSRSDTPSRTHSTVLLVPPTLTARPLVKEVSTARRSVTLILFLQALLLTTPPTVLPAQPKLSSLQRAIRLTALTPGLTFPGEHQPSNALWMVSMVTMIQMLAGALAIHPLVLMNLWSLTSLKMKRLEIPAVQQINIPHLSITLAESSPQRRPLEPALQGLGQLPFLEEAEAGGAEVAGPFHSDQCVSQ